MGSLEEERLVQMVHDFIESESSPAPVFPPSSNCHSIKHQAKFFTLQEILGSVTKEESKVLESVLKHVRRETEKTSSLKKWLVMRLKMDGFNASICHTSWVTSLGCPAGDYEYIDITLKDENAQDTMRLIVDVDFRSQFELARPTQSYKKLTDTLPNIFVGCEDKLNKIISLLCSAAKQSLRERGLHLPPWRTTTYMQCKWQSACDKVTSANGSVLGYGRENIKGSEGGGGGDGIEFCMCAPPPMMVNANKGRDLGGGGGSGSGLSSQFSNMGINCC